MPLRRKVRPGKSPSGALRTEVQSNTPPKPPPPSPATREPTLKERAKQAAFQLVVILLVTFATSYFKNASAPGDVPWKVVDLPGRGKGMVATRLIRQGERIMTEKPLFVVPQRITGSPIQLLKSRLDEITPELRAAFFELSHAESNITEEEIPLSIFQTNSISAGISSVGIFPKTARLNHACSSGFNSVYSWREEEQVLVVHALKEVQPGNELLTTYFDTKRPRHERRRHLADSYKFNCMCPVCSMPADESQASDMRLQSMTTALGKLTTWRNHEISGREALDLIRNVWRLGEEEGYWSERGQLAYDAAHMAAAHSDELATRSWAALAEEWFGYELGRDSKQVTAMRTIVDAPKQHAAWATRETMYVGYLD